MINLMYACNDDFLKGVALSLLSIVRQTKEELNIYVLSLDLTNLDEKYKMVDINKIKEVNINSKITLIDLKEIYSNTISGKKIENNLYTSYAFLRLLSDKILDLPDKIIYLDSDIMALKDIKPLFDTNISNYDYGMCQDYIGKFWLGASYCNSGVLLLNMKRLRKNHVLNKCLDCLIKNESLMPDQDALNKETNNLLILDNKYNEQKRIKDDTVLFHFSKKYKWTPYFHFTNYKQWDVKEVHEVYKIFEFDDIYKEYEEIKEAIEAK